MSQSLIIHINIPAIRAAIQEALETADLAVNQAIYVGQLLNEARPQIAHGKWQAFVEENFPEITYDTAHRWMTHAERITKFVLRDSSPTVPASRLLTAGELDGNDEEARQLLLDFMAGKTIAEAVRAAVVEGDDARAARAVAGKSTGGSRGENRKDFPKFAARHLSDLAYHLEGFDKFTDPERETVEEAFKTHLADWPRAAIEVFIEIARRDLKRREGKL
jgi:hypothetical protein